MPTGIGHPSRFPCPNTSHSPVVCEQRMRQYVSLTNCDAIRPGTELWPSPQGAVTQSMRLPVGSAGKDSQSSARHKSTTSGRSALSGRGSWSASPILRRCSRDAGRRGALSAGIQREIRLTTLAVPISAEKIGVKHPTVTSTCCASHVPDLIGPISQWA